MVTGADTLGIIQRLPSQVFKAWILQRTQQQRSQDARARRCSLMHQHRVYTILAMPAAIAKFENDLKVFFDRTGEVFPEVLKLLTPLQMVPAAWKKEIQPQFRVRVPLQHCVRHR